MFPPPEPGAIILRIECHFVSKPFEEERRDLDSSSEPRAVGEALHTQVG